MPKVVNGIVLKEKFADIKETGAAQVLSKLVNTLKSGRLRKTLRFVGDSWRAGQAPQVHWGQDGEDVFLADVLPGEGFYIDVGAHHPFRFSSTKLLYDRGWTGLNIDVTDSIKSLFPKYRQRDFNHFGLVGYPREATFFRFVEPALSTLNPEVAKEREDAGWPLLCHEVLPVKTLDSILDEVEAPGKIDLLCIDVEGADLEVLETLDFENRIVSRILVELHAPAWKVPQHPISQFLASKRYRPVAVWMRSTLFELADESN